MVNVVLRIHSGNDTPIHICTFIRINWLHTPHSSSLIKLLSSQNVNLPRTTFHQGPTARPAEVPAVPDCLRLFETIAGRRFDICQDIFNE